MNRWFRALRKSPIEGLAGGSSVQGAQQISDRGFGRWIEISRGQTNRDPETKRPETRNLETIDKFSTSVGGL